MKKSDQAPTLCLEELERAYEQGPRRIEVLKGATASFFPGEAVALLGPSGAGKSTLLHIAGLLERPDRGAVVIMALVLSILATLYPSWRASRLDPVEALRYE